MSPPDASRRDSRAGCGYHERGCLIPSVTEDAVSDQLAAPKVPPVDPLPLTGLRVLDLTLARAGPTCVRHLADWGAEIIRVEPVGSNEGFGGARDGFDFVNLHRNKRCIAIDLKDPDAHAAFLELA